MATCPGEQDDWTRRRRTRALAWHIPEVALVIAIFLDPATRTVVWAVSLLWMGVACILNARRCGRRHCYVSDFRPQSTPPYLDRSATRQAPTSVCSGIYGTIVLL